MPRFVRPFYLKGQVDGAAAPISTGPRSSDGGFELIVLQRDKGEITTAVRLWAHRLSNGKLLLSIQDANGKEVFRKLTDY